MTRVEIKQEAKDTLRGRWGTAIGILVCSFVAIFLLSFVLGLIPVIGAIIDSIIAVTITYNLMIAFIKFTRGEEVGLFDVVTKIPENFVASWKAAWGVFVKMWVYFLLTVVVYVVFIVSVFGAVGASLTGGNLDSFGPMLVVGVIALLAISIFATMKSFYYVFANYTMYDSGNTLTGKQAAEESEKLMKGKRGEYFVFVLSFLGWAFLCTFTFGIGYLWLFPYIQVATVVFYQSLSGGKTKAEVVEEPKLEETKNDNIDPIQ